MNQLTKFLIGELLDETKTVAIYGGGFKPPTKGHFNVAKQALEELPDINELKIFVGSGVRDGITQEESLAIWNIYKNYLSDKVDVEASIAPVKSVLGYAKEHPEEKVYWVLGAREGDEDDLADIANRTKSISKYPNLEVKVITSKGGVSGTKTRKAIADNNKEQFLHMIPDVEEKEQIWDMVKNLKEAVTPDELKQADTYADKQLGIDIDLTSSHLLDRLTDRESDVTLAQLIGFFKRLGKKKEEFIDFFTKFKEIVATDKRTDLNIPFLNKVNKAIAKTIMRKDDFETTNPKLVFEGRYDTITSTVVRDIMDEWKSQYDGGTGKFELEEDYDTVNSKGQPIKFELYAVLTVRKTKYGIYRVDGGADPTRKLPYLEVKFQVDPRDLPQKWEEIYMDLIDVVRHEIEHMTQQGPNVVASTTTYKNKKGEEVTRFDSKEMADDQLLRNLIKLKFLPKSEYFKLEQEVDAMLQGMYLKAKKSRTPFKDVINNYFDKARVSKKDREDILDLWKKRAKALSLPLNEVGEANLQPYKWTEEEYDDIGIEVSFETDKGVEYSVQLQRNVYKFIPVLDVEFAAGVIDPNFGGGMSSKITINKGELFKVMSTIVDIIKYYLNQTEAQGIVYAPSKKSGEEDTGNQRDNLYRAFISKAIPGAKIIQKGPMIVALLPGHDTLDEGKEPAKGTGKKPKGSSRRLYTDEDPKDTVGISFKTKQDIIDTLNKASFKSKSHARQSQIINVIHQRVRAAYGRAKDPEVKKRLKTALDYAEKRKEASKKKTERLRKMKEAADPQAGTALPYGSGFAPIKEIYQFKVSDKNYDEEDNSLISVDYKFSTPDNDYRVEFHSGEYNPEAKTFDVSFGIDQYSSKLDTFQMTGEGNALSILKTIVDIIKDFTNRFEVNKLIINPTSEKRGKVYSMVLKALPQDILNKVKLIKENDQELDKQINSVLQDWIISSLDDKEKRSSALQKLLQLNIPKEYKQVPSNTMFRIIRAEPGLTKINLDKTPYSSYAYDYKGVKKILNWYKKDYNDNLVSYLVEVPVQDVVISIPTFYKKTKIWNGKYFDQLVKTEYEVIAKNPLGEYETEIISEIKSDPFGLNELAKDFVNEVFEEAWNPKETFLSLAVFMKDNGMNVTPLPKIKVISDDKENASRLLGRTAYYNPVEKSITLYTFGRHPKDVLRSFAHEMVHHHQNLEGTLGNINTTNTNEDGHLDELEREAYEKGNIMLRNWEDSIKNV
jgi:transcription termination factor NusB